MFRPELIEFVVTPEGRDAVRAAVFDMLAGDARKGPRGELSLKLLRVLAPEFTEGSAEGHHKTHFEIGKIYNRQHDIHGRFGGQGQGGISTPAGAPVIFLFTGETGEQYGYKDGWSASMMFFGTRVRANWEICCSFAGTARYGTMLPVARSRGHFLFHTP